MIELINSRGNPKIRHIYRIINDKKYRKQCGEIVFEGEKVLLEIMKKNIPIVSVFINEALCEALEPLIKQLKNVYAVLPYIMDAISDVKTPSGIMFIVKAPHSLKNQDFLQEILSQDKQNTQDNQDNQTNLSQKNIIILDNLQDPGNLGTIIRSASSFSTDLLILSPQTTDYTSSKVVRSTMGAIFDVDIVIMDIKNAIEIIKSKNIPVYATFLDDTSISIQNINLYNSAVLIGNEANGVSPEIANLCDEKIIIPINPRINSLNASIASSIIMHYQQEKL